MWNYKFFSGGPARPNQIRTLLVFIALISGLFLLASQGPNPLMALLLAVGGVGAILSCIEGSTRMMREDDERRQRRSDFTR